MPRLDDLGGHMRSRSACTAALALAIGLLGADAAHAQGQLNLSVGLFAVRGEDARVDGDVLVENRELFLFDFKDFNTISFGAEYIAPIGEYLEVGGGVGFNSRTVDTIYDDYVRPDGTEIEQQLKLRIVPFTATVRVLPLGRNASVQPYVGGGIGLFNWRYAETGDFIDFSVPGEPIFRESYSQSGTSIGPVAVFGLRVPIGNGTFGGEIRYQKAEGDLDTLDFLGPKIDLSGFHYMATFGIRF
jgi:hypothetical protein